MDFELTDEQVHLSEVAREFVDAQCPPSVPRSVIEGTGSDRDLWKSIVGLDWPGIAVDVDHGGSGATAVELTLVVEQLGRGADPSPFLATTSQYAPLVAEAFGDRAGELLSHVCGGGTGAVVFADPRLHHRVAAERAGDSWRLTGEASGVIDADRADRIAVVASTPDGPGVFVIDADSVAPDRTPSFDGTLHIADISFDGTHVTAEYAATGAAYAVDRARDMALAGLSASTVGACQRIMDLALDHIVGRKQFGVPIGSFQAVKHMAVDVYVAIQRARALYQFAALTIAEDDPRRRVAASMAKAAAGDAQRISARHGIQLFGGLGYTWENDLQIFVRRAKAGELLLGGAAHHRAIVARAALEDRTRVERSQPAQRSAQRSSS